MLYYDILFPLDVEFNTRAYSGYKSIPDYTTHPTVRMRVFNIKNSMNASCFYRKKKDLEERDMELVQGKITY